MPARTVHGATSLLALLLTACGAGDAPPPASAAIPVSVITLKAQSVSLSRELPGRTSAFLVAEVRPQVSGIVRSRLFTEGSLVKAGQPLYQLEDATYRAAYESAKASLARVEATLVTARLSYKRAAELVKIDAISTQDFEDATAALRQAEADISGARAAVESSGVTLGYARITSPISGRIGKSSVTAGALVTANQAQSLATVQQLDPIYIDVNATSSELLQLRQEWASGTTQRASDAPVAIILETGVRYKHDGKLAFSEVSVDPTTGSFALRVQAPNPDHLLLPGMYVLATLIGGVREHSLLVPQRGVARDPAGHTSAMVVGADDKVEQRPVVVSQTVGDQWLVESGLKEGDRVIVEGLQKIRPGVVVQADEIQRRTTAQPATSASAAN
ncbi:efflux RND transporter periplasmic adaptor subunit [Povalibacter sp.]|uniref:efflux RND transporter periplasmic adaptor subunit n=1 Tax=Povalibacter sp. TaxID=1962978 RepID=UPI002F4182B1